MDTSRVETKLRPLPRGTRFRGTVYLHNVRPAELGALLWAFNLGGDGRARHTIGMGRPLGFGRCRLKASDIRLARNNGGTVDTDACVADFVAYMEDQVPGWRKTPQIEEFLALAQPAAVEETRYLRLDPGRRVNEFVDAKKAHLALQGLTTPPGARARGGGGGGGGTRRNGGRARGRGGSRGGAPAPSARPAGFREGWPGMKRGDKIRVRLTMLNKKSKWRCEAVDYPARGTIEGSAPADAKEGAEYTVEVIQGSDPKNLNLRWPS